MKRFLALLLIAMLLGAACAEVAEPTVDEISFALDATTANAVGVEAAEPAVDEVSSALGVPEPNVWVRIDLDELSQKAEQLEKEGKSEAAAALRKQIEAYLAMDQAVSDLPEISLTLPDTITLGVKESLSLPIPGAVYKSAKPEIAAVDAAGKITGKKVGTTKITVEISGMKPIAVKLTVKNAPSKITLPVKDLTLCLDEARTLKATLPKKTASAIAWVSSKPSVAAVDENGRIIGLKAGKATITAKTFNKIKATCKVTVLNGSLPKKLSVTKAVTLDVGEKLTLTPSLNDGAATLFSYAVKNSKIATVSAKGVVTGKKKGNTTITVTTHNGLTATVKVTVAKKVVTELTDLIGVNIETAVKKLGGKTKDIGKDGKDGYENAVYKKNGYTISAPRASQYKKDKYYKKVNWILLQKRNKYSILGIKPGDTVESATKKLKAAGFDDPSVYYDTLSVSKDYKAYFYSYVSGGKLSWIQYSVR